MTPQQLAMRGGQVRCGHCHSVFDGVAALLSLTPRARSELTEPELDEAALGPPTVTLREAHALEPSPSLAQSTRQRAEPSVEAEPAEGEPEDGADAEAAYAARFSWQEKRSRRWLPTWIYVVAAPLLLLLLGGQALYHFRDTIATHWPRTKPALIRLCAAAACRIRPLQEKEALSIDSELQADPAHKGLLILSATIGNHAPYPIAYPHLELTLSDIRRQTQQDVVVVRRVFSPQEYVSGTADLDIGIPGNSDVSVKLFVDASATSQAGYTVYLFYL